MDTYLHIPSALTQKDGCGHCHQEESWHAVIFDHTLTSFTLEGKHLSAKCSACHKPTQHTSQPMRFENLDKKCCDCHEDVHLGQFATEETPSINRCDRCHTPAGWMLLIFDHARDSRFPLTGAHLTLTCDRCHPTEEKNGTYFVRYKPLESECSVCHGQ